MKPFDLKAFREGKKARYRQSLFSAPKLVSYGVHNGDGIAFITRCGSTPILHREDGRHWHEGDNDPTRESNYDLFMEEEEIQGWIAIRRADADDVLMGTSCFYRDRARLVANFDEKDDYIIAPLTIKI